MENSMEKNVTKHSRKIDFIQVVATSYLAAITVVDFVMNVH